MPSRTELSADVQIPGEETHPSVRYFAGKMVKAYEAHHSRDYSPRSLHPRTVIDLDKRSHLIVKKYDGFESGEEFLIDRLELSKGNHISFVCEFRRVSNRNGHYMYEVWSPERKVGNMWGEDLDSFDLVIAGLFHKDPEIERLTKGSGMDESVRDLFMQKAEFGKSHRPQQI